MSPEDEKYYENYFDLFVTSGWKQFIEDLESTANSFDIRRVDNEAALKYAQGQLAILDRIINFEASIRTTYDDVSDNEE